MSDKTLDVFTIGAGKLIPVDHTGPALYTAGGETLGVINNMTGVSVVGLGSIDEVLGSGSLSVSGNYTVQAQPTGTGSRKTFKLIWIFSGVNGQGVTVVQNAAGSGMTVGTTVPIVFSGGTGSGAAGTVTVLTATTVSITVTNPGTYTAAPTASVSGTGGTPPTLTVGLATVGAQVTAGVNLSGETVRIGYVGR